MRQLVKYHNHIKKLETPNSKKMLKLTLLNHYGLMSNQTKLITSLFQTSDSIYNLKADGTEIH